MDVGRSIALSVLLISASTLQPQSAHHSQAAEQSSFGGEEVPGVPFIERPASIPRDVLQSLKQDETVKGCLRDNEPNANERFSSWFIASEVHLDGQHERDLIVLPNPDWQPGYRCFYSASGIQWFWVFRETGGHNNLVLMTPGNGVEILKAKHAGHRDIRSSTIGSAGRFITTILYRFDGTQYQKYREKTEEQR